MGSHLYRMKISLQDAPASHLLHTASIADDHSAKGNKHPSLNMIKAAQETPISYTAEKLPSCTCIEQICVFRILIPAMVTSVYIFEKFSFSVNYMYFSVYTAFLLLHALEWRKLFHGTCTPDMITED